MHVPLSAASACCSRSADHNLEDRSPLDWPLDLPLLPSAAFWCKPLLVLMPRVSGAEHDAQGGGEPADQRADELPSVPIEGVRAQTVSPRAE